MNNFKECRMIGKEAAIKNNNGVFFAGKIKNRRDLGLIDEPKHEEEIIQLPAGFNGVKKEQQDVKVEIPKFLLDYQDEIRGDKIEYYKKINKKAINKAKVEIAKLKFRRLIENLL